MTLAVSDLTRVIDGFRHKSMLVVGDLMVDRYVVSQGRKLSREAPVPVADYISEELVLGGAANLTNNLVSLGAKVKVLGVVGNDEAGKWVQDELRRKGVDLSGVVVNERPTSLKTRFILNHRQYLRIDKESRSDVDSHITKQFLSSLKHLVEGTDGVVFSDYDKGVDLSGVVVNERPTSLKTRFILNHRQYLRIDKESRSDVDSHITKQFLSSLKHLVEGTDGIVFSDYDKGVITPELISNVVEDSRVQGTKVLAQPKVRHYLDYIGVSMVKSNVREGAIATGVSLVNDASLRNMGHNLMTRLECDSILLTRSEQGMILFEKKNITNFPAFKGPKPGFNAVGVRDCMTAVLACSMATGAPVREAVLLAGLAASQQADKIGTVVVDLNELRSQADTTVELAERIVQVPVH